MLDCIAGVWRVNVRYCSVSAGFRYRAGLLKGVSEAVVSLDLVFTGVEEGLYEDMSAYLKIFMVYLF